MTRARGASVAALTVLTLLTAYLLLRSETPRAVDPGSPATPGTSPAAYQRAATAALLEDLEQALRRGDVRGARRLSPGGTPAALLVRGAARLGVGDIDLRPAGTAPASPDLTARFGADAWLARLEVSWRYAGVDRRLVSSSAELVLSPAGEEGASLVATRPAPGRRAPLWLLQPLAVQRRGPVMVTATDPATARRLLAVAARAVAVVRRTLPAWRGDLVVEAPRGTSALRAASGLSDAGARSLAAVTTTADGSSLPGSPARVYVNPRVFDPLGATGQRIVLSHEATHVAVGAPLSSLPVWLSEGFADHVALTGSPLPAEVLAAQARALVRREGTAPSRLPGRAEFRPGSADLGAAYESAWLAVRLIATTYGEAALLRFLRTAERRGGVAPAFRSVLGTSQAAFTRQWRRELVRLAR